MKLAFEQHEDTVFVIPTIVLSYGVCEDDCPEIHRMVGLSFLIWSVMIYT
jgi:hypothetical protein